MPKIGISILHISGAARKRCFVKFGCKEVKDDPDYFHLPSNLRTCNYIIQADIKGSGTHSRMPAEEIMWEFCILWRAGVSGAGLVLMLEPLLSKTSVPDASARYRSSPHSSALPGFGSCFGLTVLPALGL